MRVPQIGRCIGCDRSGRLEDGVCHACLTRRGRKWAEMSNRCRTDPEFALSVYESLKTDRGRELFLAMYGRAALRGTGNSIGQVRKALRAGPWEWEPELTWPPPK
jgi:hypothetical protein